MKITDCSQYKRCSVSVIVRYLSLTFRLLSGDTVTRLGWKGVGLLSSISNLNTELCSVVYNTAVSEFQA